MRLEGKVALITGAGSGIGRATAVRFAAEGARIVASDISEASASETAALIGDAGGAATAVSGDVASGTDAKAMVRAAVDAYGRLDVLLNSAGVSGRIDLGEGATHEDVWDKVMDVNMKGTYLVSWHAAPEMKAAGGGSIINIGSIMSLVGYPVGMSNGFSPYNPSKGAVLQFTRNLAVDLAPKGIRVNCICPGYVETNMTRILTDVPESYEFLKQRHPIGRLGQPEDIANAALFLASDESAFVTGAPLIVDGGYTAQ